MAVEGQNQPAQHTATPAAAQPSTERRLFVLVSIAIVAIMFVSMVGVLYWRWGQKAAPSAILVLRVPAKYDGALATVDAGDGRDIKPIRTTLEGDKVVRIALPRGTYLVKIEHNGKRVGMFSMVMDDYSYYPIDLTQPPVTRPATGKDKS